jgi:hypothetical protein
MPFSNTIVGDPAPLQLMLIWCWSTPRCRVLQPVLAAAGDGLTLPDVPGPDGPV